MTPGSSAASGHGVLMSKTTTMRRRAVVAAIAATMMTVAACGDDAGGSSGSDSGSGSGGAPIKLGLITTVGARVDFKDVVAAAQAAAVGVNDRGGIDGRDVEI